MAILVFAELSNGLLKKTSLEAVSYAVALAKQKGTSALAVAIGNAQASELEKLGNYGIEKVFHADDAILKETSSKTYSTILKNVAEANSVTDIVLSHNSTGKTIAPRLAIITNSALLPGVNALPENGQYSKTVFSGKASVQLSSSKEKNVITLNPNSYKAEANSQTAASIENITMQLPEPDCKLISVESESEGMVPLPEAEIVVSAGRGLKGPENWGMIEEMAQILGATTACSRPVADVGWRPHHEHVGQTGITIKPNLYIAIGISGAIQHLAGVNQSKCIVVINKDPEAPFFKAADYGIVGDAFEIVPKLNAALKNYKNAM